MNVNDGGMNDLEAMLDTFVQMDSNMLEWYSKRCPKEQLPSYEEFKRLHKEMLKDQARKSFR